MLAQSDDDAPNRTNSGVVRGRLYTALSANLERGVVSVEVNAAVSRVVEPLVESLEVLERQVGDGGGITTGVHAVGVVWEDGLPKKKKRVSKPNGRK